MPDSKVEPDRGSPEMKWNFRSAAAGEWDAMGPNRSANAANG
jgi:hypothetical protein